MSSPNKKSRFFKTTLSLSIGDGGEHRFRLAVVYNFTPEFDGGRDEPSHGATVEIERVRLFGVTELTPPAWLVNLVEADGDLVYSLIADAQEQDASDRAEAEDRRAEDRAERLREEA